MIKILDRRVPDRGKSKSGTSLTFVSGTKSGSRRRWFLTIDHRNDDVEFHPNGDQRPVRSTSDCWTDLKIPWFAQNSFCWLKLSIRARRTGVHNDSASAGRWCVCVLMPTPVAVVNTHNFSFLSAW
jgi:hypothetical protein